MSFLVYKIKYTLPLPDLFMPQPRYHTVLFIPSHSIPKAPAQYAPSSASSLQA